MKCPTPRIDGNIAHGCGRCAVCSRKLRYEWATRLELEWLCHDCSSFITLTYRDNDDGSPPWELNPSHTEKWLKRIRERCRAKELRFYLVGEYGERTMRPHYHVALYGYPGCPFEEQYRLDAAKYKFLMRECRCAVCSVVNDTWGFGFVTVQNLGAGAKNYIAQYVTKKMTHRQDERLWDEDQQAFRHPQFSRMSRMPGIGAGALVPFAMEMIKLGFGEWSKGDVPHVMRVNGDMRPIGRYLQARLRKLIGKSADVPAESKEQNENFLRLVRKVAWDHGKSVEEVFYEAFGAEASLLEHRVAQRVAASEQHETGETFT